jgi:hypothetical protein
VPGLGRQGDRDAERGPAARRGLHPHVAAVGSHQRRHDRQPEARAPRFPGPGLVGSVEPLEHVFRLVRRQPGALIGDLEDHGGHGLSVPAGRGERGLARGPCGLAPLIQAAGPDPDFDRRSPRRVVERVAHQIGDHLAKPGLVADHQKRRAGSHREAYVPVWCHDARVVDGVRRDRQHVHGAPFQRALLVQAGEQQHVLDQDAHAGGLLLHPLHDPVQVGPGQRPLGLRGGLRRVRVNVARGHGRVVRGAAALGRGIGRLVPGDVGAVAQGWPGRRAGDLPEPAALPVVLGVAADRGQRGPQLVAGVCDELPHPRLGAPGGLLRLGASPEGGLDLSQHGIKRPAEPAYLGPRVTIGDPAGQVAAGDRGRGLLDVGERSQAGPHHGDSDNGQDDDDGHAYEYVDLGQEPDGLVDIEQVHANDEGGSLVDELPGLRIRVLQFELLSDHQPVVAGLVTGNGDQLGCVGAKPRLAGRHLRGRSHVRGGKERYLLPM